MTALREVEALQVATFGRVLDDDEAGRLEAGYSLDLQIVHTVDAALDALTIDAVDALVVDLNMVHPPLEVLKRLCSHASGQQRVLVVTFDEVLGRRAVELGADGFLVFGDFDHHLFVQTLWANLDDVRPITRFRDLLGSSPDGLLVLDQDGMVIFANLQATEMLDVAEPIGTHFGIPIEHRELHLNSGRVAEMRVAEIRWLGQPAFLTTLRDVTERNRAYEELVRESARLNAANARLQKASTTDPLTETLNRRGLQGVLLDSVANALREGSSLTCALFDCDDFKSINTAGYTVGDAVLRTVGQSLANAARATDFVGRVGGDEFMVIFPHTRVAEAAIAADKLRRAVSGASLPPGCPRAIGLSVGVTQVPLEAASLDEVFALVQGALNSSKLAGKDRVTVRGGSSAALEAAGDEVVRALTRTNALRSLAQPIVRLADGSQHAIEVLVRGPLGPVEMPSDLLREANSRNMLTAFDLRCLRLHLKQIQKRSADERFHINVLPTTLETTPDDELMRLLGMAPRLDALCIEVNEQYLIGEPHVLRPARMALREHGVEFALDNVGFGRSTLEAMIVLEPDIVNIDRRWIEDCASNPEKRQPLARLLGVVQSLPAVAVAKCIERPEDARMLLEMGIELGQGFLFGAPYAFGDEAHVLDRPAPPE